MQDNEIPRGLSSEFEHGTQIEWKSGTQVLFEKKGQHLTIKLRGEFGVDCARRLKTLLQEAMARYEDLELDLSEMLRFDMTLLQLILAAQKEQTARTGGIVVKVSETIAAKGRHAGFGLFPGMASES